MLNYHWLYYICVSLILYPSVVQAQVLPDNTLPQNSEVSTQENIIQIDGGTEAGTNLFHSFEQFSLSEGNTALFNNDLAIENIFSRVTGGEISNINGLIQANGTANLLLVNPNGIIFGEQASLDVGGSFFASTAESILFEDDLQFSATNPEATPLLTVSVPIGLQFGSNPGTIINRSVSTDDSGASVGLQVSEGNTLGLIGGEIAIEGGIITAASGRIELGSVGDDSLVELTPMGNSYTSNFENVQTFQDIELSEFALVDVSGDGGGSAIVEAANLKLTDGSQIVSNTLGSENAGELIIKASDSVEMSGESDDGSLPTGLGVQVLPEAEGNGGKLTVVTPKLLITDGASINASTLGAGNAGEVNVTANLVEVIGTSEISQFPSGITALVNSEGQGNGGDVIIDTSELRIVGGGQVAAVTFGKGDAGKVVVTANQSVEVLGETADGLLGSSLGVFVAPGAIGNGGALDIKTGRLRVTGGAEISANTFGVGNAGNLTVKATEIELIGRSADDQFASSFQATVQPNAIGNGGNISVETVGLRIIDGAQISVGTFGEGDGGELMVIADSIEIVGASVDNPFPSGLFAQVDPRFTPEALGNGGDLTIETNSLSIADGGTVAAATFGLGDAGNLTIKANQIEVTGSSTEDRFPSIISVLADVPSNGNAGILNIETDSLLVSNGGQVSASTFSSGQGGELNVTASKLAINSEGSINVSATSTGEAGSLTIEAGDIDLDRGNITAETRTGDRGNIILSNADSLLLRNNSQITTNASESATGGDITIAADVIAGLDNSDITANAVAGRGGNIQINTQGLFLEPDSEITASSELGIDGTITFNTPEVDPTSGLVELPDLPIDAAAILAQDVCKFEDEKIAGGSSFIITGRGGLTPTAEDSLSNRDRVVTWSNRDDLEVSNNGLVGIRQREVKQTAKDSYPVIQQSQGLIVASDGSVWLTANTPQAISQNSGIVHPNCETAPQSLEENEK